VGDTVVKTERKVEMKYLVVLFAVFLVACGTTSTSMEGGVDPTTRMGVDQLGRTPLPVGTKLRGPDSLIFGSGDNWMGRAVVEMPTDASTTFNFFAEQYPRQGWATVAAVRGKKNLLVFTRGDRSTTIEMDEGGFLGSLIATITVSPTGGGINVPTGAVSQPVGGAGARRP
jgi:hypothetical protein